MQPSDKIRAFIAERRDVAKLAANAESLDDYDDYESRYSLDLDITDDKKLKLIERLIDSVEAIRKISWDLTVPNHIAIERLDRIAKETLADCVKIVEGEL